MRVLTVVLAWEFVQQLYYREYLSFSTRASRPTIRTESGTNGVLTRVLTIAKMWFSFGSLYKMGTNVSIHVFSTRIFLPTICIKGGTNGVLTEY